MRKIKSRVIIIQMEKRWVGVRLAMPIPVSSSLWTKVRQVENELILTYFAISNEATLMLMRCLIRGLHGGVHSKKERKKTPQQTICVYNDFFWFFVMFYKCCINSVFLQCLFKGGKIQVRQNESRIFFFPSLSKPIIKII